MHNINLHCKILLINPLVIRRRSFTTKQGMVEGQITSCYSNTNWIALYRMVMIEWISIMYL